MSDKANTKTFGMNEVSQLFQLYVHTDGLEKFVDAAKWAIPQDTAYYIWHVFQFLIRRDQFMMENEKDNLRRAAFHLREYAGLRQKLSSQWNDELQNIVDLAIKLEGIN